MSTEYPVRVLCVFSTLDRGGAESMCMNLYRNIDRKKVQFDFVKHTSGIGTYEEEIQSLGGRIFEAPRFKMYNYLQYAHWWNDHLEKHQEHQIIHGHYFSISAVYFRIAKQKGRKTVGHIHASAADNRIKEILEMQISRYADYAFACSAKAGKWIYKERPFKVIHNAIDIEEFRYSKQYRQEVRKQLGLGNELTLGTVANLSQVKNPMGLIDIFIEINRLKPQTKLIWVGSGGLREEVDKRIRKERLEDKIMMLGMRTDVSNLLQAMDAFLLPSFNEGLPVSVIEAQASGLPCFISKNITSEVDVTGLCHFLPIDDPYTWAKEILKDVDVRIDTSDFIRKAGYDIKATAETLKEFYINAMDK